MSNELDLTVQELTQTLDDLIKKQERSDELRTSIIKMQEDLISELLDELNLEKSRRTPSFKAGIFAGLIFSILICIIISVIISAVR